MNLAPFLPLANGTREHEGRKIGQNSKKYEADNGICIWLTTTDNHRQMRLNRAYYLTATDRKDKFLPLFCPLLYSFIVLFQGHLCDD